jgi:PHP family Zn ribbon phosphoesterase
MIIRYDFHIHTALSPCALDEMTPNNIVNMSIISELEAIAITDHNSAANVESVLKVAEGSGLVVIPGMEVETREEIHMVCLFPDLQSVLLMQQEVYQHLPTLKNKPKVFGHQLLLDEEDEIITEEQRLLSFATSLSFEEVVEKAWQHGGIAIPAHIDRPSYSVISNLGMLPPSDKLHALEVSQYADFETFASRYKQQFMLQSSDSHELGHIGICGRSLDLTDDPVTPRSIINFLREGLQDK